LTPGESSGDIQPLSKVIVDYPFITGRSTPDSYLTGQKMVEVMETGLTRWGLVSAMVGPTSVGPVIGTLGGRTWQP
jgi:hypothetical protein